MRKDRCREDITGYVSTVELFCEFGEGRNLCLTMNTYPLSGEVVFEVIDRGETKFSGLCLDEAIDAFNSYLGGTPCTRL